MKRFWRSHFWPFFSPRSAWLILSFYKMFFAVFLALTFLPVSALWAESLHCKMTPLQFLDFSDRAVKKRAEWNRQHPQKKSNPNSNSSSSSQSDSDFHQNVEKDQEAPPEEQGGLPFPDEIPIQFPFQAERDFSIDKKMNMDFVYESILRPKATANFTLLNLFLFKLERSRHLMYVCLLKDAQNKERTQLTIYFLKAFGLEPIRWNRDNWTTIPGDWIFGPGKDSSPSSEPVTQLARIPIEILPIHSINHGVDRWMVNLPIVGELFRLPGAVMGFSNTFWEGLDSILGVGVQRIKINSQEIEFANEVDPENPEEARILYRFPLN